MPQALSSSKTEERRARGMRLGFRVDAETKKLVERAAAIERRSLTDFCLTALTEATRATITRHESLVLSSRDRAAFFEALIHAPKPNARLRRAFQASQPRGPLMALITNARYRLEPLGKAHNRPAFNCGIESLDSYLKTQASQDMRRKANAVFVLTPENLQAESPDTSLSAPTAFRREPSPTRRASTYPATQW